MSTSFEGSAPRRGFPIKRDGGQNVTGTRFCQKITPEGVHNHKNYTAEYAFFIHNSLHSKITQTACVLILALKIDHN